MFNPPFIQNIFCLFYRWSI